MLKVKMELTQPVHDPDGIVALEPGTRFEQGDPFLASLPPGHVRPVIVEEPDPAPKPAPKAAAKAKSDG